MGDNLTEEQSKSADTNAQIRIAGQTRSRRDNGRNKSRNFDIAGLATSAPDKILSAFREEADFGHDFLWFPVTMALGATLWFGLDRMPDMVPVFAVFVLTWVVWLVIGSRPVLRYAVLLVAGFATGMAAAQIETWRHATTILDGDVTAHIRGHVEARDIDHRGYWRYTIRLTGTRDPTIRRPPELVRILATAPHMPIEIGEAIEGLARMGPPSGPALPGGYDFSFNAFFKGLGAYGFFYGRPHPLDLAPEGENRMVNIRVWLNRLRERISVRIRTSLSGDTGALASALAVADRRAISKDTVDALRASGLAHILAISGLHMALLAGSVFVLIWTVLSLPPSLVHSFPTRKIAAVFALAAATFYLLISGAAVSTQRAWLMFAIFLAAVFVDRMGLTLRNVALAATIIILLSPSAVIGPGFQMSFAATVALISAYAVWTRPKALDDTLHFFFLGEPVRLVLRFVAGIAVTSAVAGLATTLFAIEHFHRIAPYGLLANLAAMPVVTFMVMPFGLLSLVAMPLHLEYWPLQVMGAGLDIVIAIARAIEDMGGMTVTGRIGPAPFALALSGFLIAVLMRSWLRFAGVPLFVAGLFWGLGTAAKPVPDLLVSEDGELVAFVTDRAFATNTARPSAFIMDQWKAAFSREIVTTPVRVGKTPELSLREKRKRLSIVFHSTEKIDEIRFSCVKDTWCAGISGSGLKVAVPEDLSFLGAACDEADVVIVPKSINMRRCHAGAVLLTGKTLRRSGAIELYKQGETLIAVGAIAGKRRSWTAHRYYDWRTQSFAPD